MKPNFFIFKLAWNDLKSGGWSLWVFCACLILGVTLVAASASLYQTLQSALLSDTRTLMGGDLQVESNQPLPENAQSWILNRGDISKVIEMDTMLGTKADNIIKVELQTVDENYPLYGKLTLQPNQPVQSLLSFKNAHWGILIDPILANKMNLALGDFVTVGYLKMQVRGLILDQPNRRLSANWRGTPVLLSEQALNKTGLLQPGSRVEYEYFVRTSTETETWRQAFYEAFPDQKWEVRTFQERSRRIAERLGQIASGLILIGLSTLFIGGLGVFNSIQAYLKGKLKTIATLSAVGLRKRQLACMYLIQIALLSAASSLVGSCLGGALALLGTSVIAAEIQITPTLSSFGWPLLMAFGFGIWTAFSFAIPALGRALSIQPVTLFRGFTDSTGFMSKKWLATTWICGAGLLLLIVLAVPDLLFGLAFIGVIGLVLLLLELVVRGIRNTAQALENKLSFSGFFVARLAISNLHRPESPLRTSLLSLGASLTLLVACTLVVTSLIRTIHETIPEEAPALVLYDILSDQLDTVSQTIEQTATLKRFETAPLINSRVSHINGQPLSEITTLEPNRIQEAERDNYKLSHTSNNIDSLTIVEGAWWTEPVSGPPKMAMEDREAYQLGLSPGDTVTFNIQGNVLEAELAAIYKQKGLQTQFWFEAVFSEGALNPFIQRYVGTAYMADSKALELQNQLGKIAPNVVTVRTETILTTAKDLLKKASIGLTVVAAISFAASLLVLVTVMAAGKVRQVYESTILTCIGARFADIKISLYLEYLLLAIVTSVFSIILGAAIALPLLHFRLKLPTENLLWYGVAAALFVSILSLSLSAIYWLKRLKLKPSLLLRNVD